MAQCHLHFWLPNTFRADARQARDQELAIVAAKEKQPREELPLARRLSMIKVADLKTTELALVQLFAKDCAREQFRREERERMRAEMRSEMEEERKTLESEKEKIKEAKECTICLERDVDVVFSCGHQACETCGDKLKICHICREVIKSRIKLY